MPVMSEPSWGLHMWSLEAQRTACTSVAFVLFTPNAV